VNLDRSLVVLEGGERDHDGLVSRIGSARFVLIGEASHGSREFYRERARLTRRLIEELGFDAVAIEADWPDALHVHHYVEGANDARDAREALGGFTRFPAWMWRNVEVLDFVHWLRSWNDGHPQTKVGFYGLDLYGMFDAIAGVLRYLERHDRSAAARARERYACLTPYIGEASSYALAALRLNETCERAVHEQLREMRERRIAAMAADDELFGAEQNAALVKSAELYYRSMIGAAAASWNVRDRHMADTLGEIAHHLDENRRRPSRIVVWEHNSHVGDARATEVAELGEMNVGQLARERYGRDAFLIGMTTYDGSVTAAPTWEAPAERMSIVPAMPGSFEALFHDLRVPSFLLLPDTDGHLPAELDRRRLERAIGVVYRPQTERASHWFHARLASQFDAVVHFDRTSAIDPLDARVRMAIEPPETYPFAV
jgi:erythromycin esterase-like protein